MINIKKVKLNKEKIYKTYKHIILFHNNNIYISGKDNIINSANMCLVSNIYIPVLAPMSFVLKNDLNSNILLYLCILYGQIK
jgi:hypothetical protein